MTETRRPYAAVLERLREVNLRPTRQRLALARLLFAGGDRHVTAESLYNEARANRVRVSLATIYNTLNQFTEAGLLREVVVDASRSYFDTNTSHHHHFFCEEDRCLVDIPGEELTVAKLPHPPPGTTVTEVDIMIRVRKNPALEG
ncbi:MAG: Fur family transcriptional regulator [Alphaproteobacteria bacterium]